MHGFDLGATGDGSSWESGEDAGADAVLGGFLPRNLRHEVVHVGQGFDAEVLFDLDAANGANPAEVVAFEIDEHVVFGQFFGVVFELEEIRGLFVVASW